MKKLVKILGILILLLILFGAYVVWINLKSGSDNDKVLSSLPQEISPKYSIDKSRNWWKETSVYQIYPRSYKDSDGDGIGDINGIISQLDYIKSLGFETIWFSPFFESPQTDHGYDISDYLAVQPEYGDLSILDSLITEVHNRDMKIVFDLVLNHTSIEHDWFIESSSSKDNPKSDWYVWRDGKDDGPPNNWKNILGQLSGWNYVPERDQYYYAAFLPFQPDLNMANPEVKTEIFKIVRHWLDKGVDGFRLDIFNFIFEDDNFPDNPMTLQYLPKFDEGKWLFEEHRYNFHQPEVIEFAKELRAILESYPDGRFMVGEVFGGHQQMRELLGLENHDGLNLVFLFDFLDHFTFSAEYFRDKVLEYEAIYPFPLVPTYVFSNHDQFRSITRLDNNPHKADVLAAFQLTMRGVPFVYQGEEIGMTTGSIDIADAQDPLSRYWLEVPEWVRNNIEFMLNRDNCRTPMQWSDETSAGFSSSQATWLPVQENYKSINVENQLNDRGSLLNTYKDLLNLRAELPALREGKLSMLEPESLPDDVLAYTRSLDNDKLTIYLNFSDEPRTITLAFDKANIKYLKRASLAKGELKLEGFGIMVLED